MSIFNKYPYTDFHELNLDIILKELNKMANTMDNFISLEKVKFADPFQYDYRKSYEINTIVLGADGNSYMSKKEVSPGHTPPEEEYWLLVGNYNAQLEECKTEVNTISEIVYAMKNNNFKNVKDYGAKGDGKSDDTQYFKNAIADCTENGYKTLFIPCGVYLINETLEKSPSFNSINIIGENSISTIIKTNFDGVVFKLNGGSGSICKSLIANFTISNNGTTKGTGIASYGLGGVDIKRMHFENYDKAIACVNTQNNFTEFVIADECDITNCNYAMYIGKESGSTQYSFHGCGLRNCTIRNTREHILYIDAGCFLYNGIIDFACWESGKNSFVYLNGDNSSPIQTRSITANGNIRYECENAPTIFDGVNVSKVVFGGNVMGLGGNTYYDLGKNVYMANGVILSDGALLNSYTAKSHRFDNVTSGKLINGNGLFNIEYHASATNFEEYGFLKACWHPGLGGNIERDIIKRYDGTNDHTINFEYIDSDISLTTNTPINLFLLEKRSTFA